jgi:pimeloyl-ACP methyl ester carboxylesterase
VVLIDTTHPDQSTRLPVDYDEVFDAQVKQFDLLGKLAHLGILRFGVRQFAPTWTLPEEVLPTYYAIMSRPKFYETSVAEASVFETSMEQTRQTGNLGDRPLVVLTAGQLDEEIAAYPGVDEDAYRASRMMLQEELATLSTNSRLIVAEKSDHMIQLNQPELVIDAILQVVEMCRAGQ